MLDDNFKEELLRESKKLKLQASDYAELLSHPSSDNNNLRKAILWLMFSNISRPKVDPTRLFERMYCIGHHSLLDKKIFAYNLCSFLRETSHLIKDTNLPFKDKYLANDGSPLSYESATEAAAKLMEEVANWGSVSDSSFPLEPTSIEKYRREVHAQTKDEAKKTIRAVDEQAKMVVKLSVKHVALDSARKFIEDCHLFSDIILKIDNLAYPNNTCTLLSMLNAHLLQLALQDNSYFGLAVKVGQTSSRKDYSEKIIPSSASFAEYIALNFAIQKIVRAAYYKRLPGSPNEFNLNQKQQSLLALLLRQLSPDQTTP